MLFMFHVCLYYTILSVPVTCEERADLLALLCVIFSLCFCHFPCSVSGSDVGLDCIDS